MRLPAVPLLSIAMAAPLLGQALVGPVTYTKAGVVLAGRTVAWKEVTSIEEREADAAAEYAAMKKAELAFAQFEVGRWCREHGLQQEAETHFLRALELEAAHEGARCALGRAPELVAAKAKTLPCLEFADWCRDHALVDEQWKAIVGALAKDNYDRAAIARVKPRMERRCGQTLLRPPFAGRWKALVDTTRHHQLKCFAIYAIDFAMVDERGRLFRSNGKQVTDYLGFDQPVLAVADGKVTAAEGGFEDNVPGKPGKFDEANHIELTHDNGETTTYAHFKKGSVCVKAGDRVKKGDVIARVGNSGASGMPHLHFTMDLTVWVGSEGVVIGQPWRIGECRLVDAGGVPCSIELKAARPQEGWVLECPPAAR